MWSDDSNKHQTLPIMAILAVGALCIWASQSWADTTQSLAVQNRIDLAVTQLEGQCDQSRAFKNKELTEILSRDIDAACDREKDRSCKAKRIHFGRNSYEVSAVRVALQKTSCGSYRYEFRTGGGVIKSRQQVIDESLGYPCESLRTRQDPKELEQACIHQKSNQDLAKEAVSEILAARGKIQLLSAPAATGSAISRHVNKASETGRSSQLEGIAHLDSSAESPQESLARKAH